MSYSFSMNLIEEGILNEFCSFIQNLRKQLNLALNDRIKISLYLRSNDPCLVTITKLDENGTVVGTASFDLVKFTENQLVASDFLLFVRGLQYIAEKLQVEAVVLSSDIVANGVVSFKNEKK